MKTFSFSKQKQPGFSLMEVLLAIALLSIIVTSVTGAIIYGRESTALSGKRARATLIAEEGLEAVRSIRDEDFSNLTNGTHGIAITNNTWTLSGTSDITDIFNREVTISEINSTTKEITSKVTWQQNLQRTGEIILKTYLTHWMLPTIIDGWGNSFVESNIDISGSLAFGMRIQVDGDYAYLSKYLLGLPDFFIVDITDTNNPFISGSLDVPTNPEDIDISGNRAYVISNDQVQELAVIDISDKANPTLLATYNAPGIDGSKRITINNNRAYILQDDNNFLVVNITNNTPSLLGSLDLGHEGKDVIVIGDYAYTSSEMDSQELRVIDISDTNNLTIVGSYDLNGSENGNAITGFDETIIIGRTNGEVSTIDISDPTDPVLLDTINTDGDVRDMILGNNDEYVFLGTDNSNAEFQILDISNPSKIFIVEELDTGDTLNGIAYSSTKNRAFGVGPNGNEEFIILAPD